VRRIIEMESNALQAAGAPIAEPGSIAANEPAPAAQAAVPVQEPNVVYKDMGTLSFITNSVIADLIRMVRDTLKQGKELRLLNVPAALKAVIRKLGLSGIIKIS
jgi:ABC-type transporter Mla MlaB component